MLHRDETARAQRELAAIDGVTALIHFDPCAAEERRLRTRGQRPALTESVWINSRVCEGCGDCADHATCMSLVHVDTEFGTKMSVHQGSCNLDKSCVKGECPSFVVGPPRPAAGRGADPEAYPAPPASLPDPPVRPWSGTTVIRMPGIGGTGVVTASRITQMAAHLAGLHAAGIDQTGLAQKNGPVMSDVRISSSPIEGDVHASPGGADVLLGFDLLGAAGDDALSVTPLRSARSPCSTWPRRRRPPCSATNTRPIRWRQGCGRGSPGATRADDMVCVDAQTIAEQLTGDHLAANLVLIGAAFQSGLLPFGAEELAEAVRLNGVDVQASLAAIAWGRAAVASPEAVAAALARRLDPASLAPDGARARPSPALGPARRCRHSSSPIRAGPRASRRRDPPAGRRAHRLPEATGWPRGTSSRCARWRRGNGRRTGQLSGGVTETFARGLYALTAIKDEYEVARLHLLDEEREAFATAFPGARPVYMLKPPLLAHLGLQRKIKLVRSARPAFHVLRAARHLRGTPFDPFGWTAERTGRTAFLAEYLSWVALALEHLTPATVDAVRGHRRCRQ